MSVMDKKMTVPLVIPFGSSLVSVTPNANLLRVIAAPRRMMLNRSMIS